MISRALRISIRCLLTLKAYNFSASERPGNGWNRVPARDTIATLVTGPWKSLAAILIPCASPVWYWKEPEAGSAKPRLCCCHACRTARCARRDTAERGNIIEKCTQRSTNECVSFNGRRTCFVVAFCSVDEASATDGIARQAHFGADCLQYLLNNGHPPSCTTISQGQTSHFNLTAIFVKVKIYDAKIATTLSLNRPFGAHLGRTHENQLQTIAFLNRDGESVSGPPCLR